AEGAEVAGQVAQLQSMGCEFGQGYYFSRPVDLDGVTALLTQPSWPAKLEGYTGTGYENQRRVLAESTAPETD
ncbi:MAG TPA: hypothetical protein VFL54_04770, partial [Gammaproteobacteria bacterium]|nr:hypothetical protein [Gammaproteobacteria bacterium]